VIHGTRRAVDRVIPEHKLRCRGIDYHPGGGGINVSRAIKKLGGESTAVFTAGGANGKLLESLMAEEQVLCSIVPIQQRTRESLTVLEESTGLQYRFNMEGPTLTEREWTACVKALVGLRPSPRYMVLSGNLPPGAPPDLYASIAKTGHDLGARVIVDTSGDPLRLAIDTSVFLVKPNLRELEMLVGRELRDEAEQEDKVMEIVRAGMAQVVVVSLGAAGVLLATNEGTRRIRAPAVHIKSKVGAGDSTVAGITISLARGRAIAESVMYGIAAGSAAVMTPGTELCALDDTERLFATLRAGYGSIP
jgi:6-phosphofructokinase 2